MSEPRAATVATAGIGKGFWSRLASRLDDAVNPIVVKEMRQAARGRFLVGLLLFYLGAQLLALGIYLMSSGIDTVDLLSGREHGAEAFALLFGVLMFVLLLCLPIYAAIRFAVERSGDGLALLFVSTLSPRRIVAGKLASNLLLGALMLAAGLPYLMFTYFLRGIDLATMLGFLFYTMLATLFVVSLAIFVAALPLERLLRLLVALGGLFVLGWVFVLGVAILADEASSGSLFGGAEFWARMAFAGVVVLAVGLLFQMTVSIISPPASDRARPVRRYLVVTWLLTAGGALLAGTIAPDAMRAWAVLWTWCFVLSLLASVGSRDRPSRRVAAKIPRSPLWRWPWLLLTTGTFPGLLFAVVMLALTLLVGLVASPWSGHEALLGVSAQALAYCLLGLELHRRWLHHWLPRSATMVVVLASVATLSLVPTVAGFLLFPEQFNHGSAEMNLFLLFNPVAFSDGRLGTAAVAFSVGWAALMLALTLPRLRRMAMAYEPQDEGDLAPGLILPEAVPRLVDASGSTATEEPEEPEARGGEQDV